MENLYSSRSNLIIGFHGCDRSLAEKVICGKERLKMSHNDYDWLGNGIYFWENNYDRAFQWASDNAKRANSKISEPAVIGAVIDLGFCLDLTDSKYLNELKQGYETLVLSLKKIGLEIPRNLDLPDNNDKLLRKLDCAVIETLHSLGHEAGVKAYDSVKGVFVEGDELYPGAGFHEKNHIQICLRNPNCIKGYFMPLQKDENYPNP